MPVRRSDFFKSTSPTVCTPEHWKATTFALGLVLIGLTPRSASAQLMPKAQVANLIAKVENGVDEFRNYLEKRGDNARDTASTARAQGKTSRRKATDTQKAKAGTKKDALDDARGASTIWRARMGCHHWESEPGPLLRVRGERPGGSE